MCKNLIAEMARADITNGDIASYLGVHANTISNKINGKSKFSIEEAFKIKARFFPEIDLIYLFSVTT